MAKPPHSEASPAIAKVIVNLSLDRVFDYLIPERLLGGVRPGMKVNIPFGKAGSLREGYVLALASFSERDDLKGIDSICESHPRIPDNLLKLGEWMALYYCCSKEHAVRALLPGAVRSGRAKPKSKAHFYISDAEKVSKFIVEHGARSKAKAAMLKSLGVHHGMDLNSLLQESGAGKGVLDSLVKMGLVSKEDRIVERDPFRGAGVMPDSAVVPTDEQAEALRKIFEMMDRPGGSPHTLLLHGVTGSGKTEVYLQAIARALERGGDAIALVPEISLTPQTVERFRARFGDMVSVLHSGLSDGERHDEWMKVHRGSVRIAVGARSALFAPFKRLALIVVDEEHENSYKQSEAPRYNARDVAVMRGRMEGAAVILGSATPSMESSHNAAIGKYALATLTRRTDPRILMPEIKLVDMRLEDKGDGKLPFFSNMLVKAVRERISRGEQTIIFLNKRGFARQMICTHCGYVAQCADCSVAKIYHRKAQTLSCHLCGAVEQAPAECPDCGSDAIKYSGLGTERVEFLSETVFKGARIARMDSDTMTRPSLYEKTLKAFRRSELDILIGTQMIAKGLHFPNVTLVGIINADMALYLPDFRSAERTFQLLTQVAGRAGRGDVKGEVIVQTCTPFNTAIGAAARHDYQAFYEEEMDVRKELSYPPFGHLIALHFSGPDTEEVERFANAMMDRLRPNAGEGCVISDPAPAPIERVKGRYRYIAIFRGKISPSLRRLLRDEALHARRPKGVEAHLDVDALSLL